MTKILQTALDRLQRLAETMPEDRQALLAKRILETLPEEEAEVVFADDVPFVSAYDLAKDLIGSIEGPGDLSTNPKYLEDLGQRSMR